MLKFVLLLAFVAIASNVECGWFGTPKAKPEFETLRKLNDYLEKEAHLIAENNPETSKVIEAADQWLKSGTKHDKALREYLENFVKLRTLADGNICLPESYNLLRALNGFRRVLRGIKNGRVAGRVIDSYITHQGQFCYGLYNQKWLKMSKSIDPRDEQWVTAFMNAVYAHKLQSRKPSTAYLNGPAGLGYMLKANPLDDKDEVSAMFAGMKISYKDMKTICKRYVANPAAEMVFAAIANMYANHTWIYHRSTDDFHWVMAKHFLCQYLVEEGIKPKPEAGQTGGSGVSDSTMFLAGGMIGLAMF